MLRKTKMKKPRPEAFSEYLVSLLYLRVPHANKIPRAAAMGVIATYLPEVEYADFETWALQMGYELEEDNSEEISHNEMTLRILESRKQQAQEPEASPPQ